MPKAIVIDNGSYQCRAGFANDFDPQVVLRSLVGKARAKKEGDITYVGADLRDDEIARSQTRSPFDKNVMYHLETQEIIFDRVFDLLGVSSDTVEHPVVLTEPVCNPNYSRKLVSELMFECYQVPRVCYGIDSLFSYHQNMSSFPGGDALVLGLGHSASHIIPVIGGSPVLTRTKRLSIGGYHCTEFMLRLVSVKYPQHRSLIHWGKAQQLTEEHTYVAKDYTEELLRYQNDPAYAAVNDRVLQLPFIAAPEAPQVTEEERLRKQQVRKEAGNRLRDAAIQRRKEKIREQEEQLAALEDILDLKNINPSIFKEELNASEYKTEQRLVKAIAELQSALEKARNKDKGLADDSSAEKLPVTQDDSVLYPLLDIPDEELTPEQQKEKKKQKFVKSTGEGRAKAKQKREQEKAVRDKQKQEEEERRRLNPASWITEMRTKRQALLDKKQEKEKRRNTKTERKGQAMQERMRLVAEAALGGMDDKNDTFGMNDEDWLVYKAMANESDEEDEEIDAQLKELEVLLQQHDPDFIGPPIIETTNGAVPEGPSAKTKQLRAEDFQVHIGVERIRVPELLFEPSLCGMDQMGIAECTQFVISRFQLPQQLSLANNILVTGGCTMIPNMRDRILKEVISIMPFQSSVRVLSAQDPLIDTWRGAAKWAMGDQFRASCITREEYLERGGDYFKQFSLSNVYAPTPEVINNAPESTQAQSGVMGGKRKRRGV
mmetsp:Transcript_39669/g.64339  ORF Transcript_39669/g.64339 Transcript_39669/m.64339 type:complete len:718 (-) Transcript_39669:340-2493(-)